MRVWKTVRLSGNHYDLGRQHGEKLSGFIHDSIDLNFKVNGFYTGLTKERMRRSSRKCLAYLKKNFKHYHREIEGISEGSGERIEDVMMLNLHGRDMNGACTLFSIPPQFTEDGKAIIGQSVDWTPLLKPFYFIAKLQDKEHDVSIDMFTEAGIIGLVGKNSAGIGELMSLLLTDRPIREGLPAYLVLRNVLEQKRIGDALNAVLNVPRASPFNYLVSDDSGEIYDVEATPDSYELFYPDDRIYSHTNHVQGPSLASSDIYVRASNSCESIHRCNRIGRLLRERARDGPLKVEDAMEAMKDHANFPDSICRHPLQGISPEGQFETIGAIVLQQGTGGFWITQGNPCENRFYHVS
ncbi:MAG: hypothetical protein JRM99_01445 [Nitrososphaerota archaeon]|nr:hypothetical protein [Nitrososphaerota archaeon]